ncbi:MAG: MATE family efflux transporter, partial [Ruminiclostridium sp.]|nr:MATE family efflux transporter [Ruminiclostridium sp.]
MSNKFGKDLTIGSIPKHLITFSLPMLLGNVLQTGYGIVNTVWVGNKVGPDAVAATAVSFPIIFILIALAAGATLATTILVSQYYGARDYAMVEKVINNSFSISIIGGLLLTITGILSSDWLLKTMGTPEEVFIMASSYLKITLAGFVLLFMTFLISSILRGIGDTVTPLIFMGIGLALNAILDPLMIIGIGPFPKLGLDGAAYASLIAQSFALILALVYLNRKNHIVAIKFKKLSIDKHLTFLLFKLGFPSMIQQSLISIGVFVVTGFVNSFGAVATAAFGSAQRIENLVFMPAMSLSMAVSALTGQNLGAGKPERVKEIFRSGIILTSIITLALSAAIITFPKLMLSMFVQEPDILEIGVHYLRIVGASYIFFAIMFISNGIINGSGHTITTMVISL